MKEKKKVLIVTQEMEPYAALSEIAAIARKLPQFAQEKRGMEVRVLMPRYGTINERRHRLHEVVRLSGMNIIVDDEDYPLIIKVASLPGARMQVYFLDNEDFFKRKSVFDDAKGEPFKDNPDRMIFFCKGIIETVKKFGWPPDIVHCHGWMTSMLPMYLREAYKNEPLFENSKIVYSMYNNSMEGSMSVDAFKGKAAINSLEEKHLDAYLQGEGVTLNHGAMQYSDAIIRGSAEYEAGLEDMIAGSDLPVLPHQTPEDYLVAYLDFYHSLMEQEESVEG